MADADGADRRSEGFRSLRVGDVVRGTVSGLTSYGAFVEIGDAPGEHLYGLVHVSELPPGGASRPADAVRLGEAIRVRVIEVNPDRNRIMLSLRGVGTEQGGTA